MANKYPPEFIDKAMMLAAAIGVPAAGRQLDVSKHTIYGWIKNPEHSPRWAELRRLHAGKWRERAAIPMEDLVDEFAEAEALLLRQLLENAHDLEPRDIATALRSIAVAKGVTADHVGKLRGQPAQIVEHRLSTERLEAGIQQLLAKAADVDGSAEEIPEIGPPDAEKHE